MPIPSTSLTNPTNNFLDGVNKILGFLQFIDADRLWLEVNFSLILEDFGFETMTSSSGSSKDCRKLTLGSSLGLILDKKK